MVVVRRALVILVAGTLGYSGATWGQALSSNEPSGRVGRLAFTQGTVSYHDSQRTDWEPATINQPLSTGDAVWTEPGAHSEISIAGTRVRMDGATQLDMATLDDHRTRLQVDQGRVDVKTVDFDTRQPYEIATPRGVASLQQQGDYYVEAGSTQDPTRLGVRQGAAQFQAPDGRTMAVRAGEVAEITGDGSTMQLHTIKAPPPPMPQYWAQRDRVVAYERPPQYLSAGVTGYEDLNYYGTWNNDPEYGQVWSARNVPVGWSPYTTGRWVYQPVYGWTWVDEQPWGFAPYHYGRWAQRNNRWFWVPPERSQRAVYAPALVAFIGGTELGIALGMQPRQPVGWFPLGPREIYVPPYYSNRDYYRRLNLAARVQDQILEERWERAQRREAIAEQNWQNRRFATVVPADAFARSQPVERVRLRFDAQKIAAAPVAAVAVPPSPTVSVRAVQAPGGATAPDATRDRAQRAGNRTPDEPKAGATAQAQPAMLQAIKPEPQAKKAPGPQVVSRSAVTTNTDAKAGTDAKASTDAKAALPQLAPRNARAAPPPQIKGEREPAAQQATAPANQPASTPKPGEPAKPGEPQARTTPNANAPTAQPKPEPGQANLPAARDRNERRPEPPKPGEPQARTTPNATAPTAQPPKPAEPPKPPQATNTPAAPKAVEPPHAQPAPQPRQATPQSQPAPQPHQATPPAPPPQAKERESHAAPPPQQAAPQPQAQGPNPQPQAQPQQQQAQPQQQKREKPDDKK